MELGYCDKPQELEKNPDAWKHIRRITEKNPDAFQFCKAMWNFEHVYDDLVDGEKVSTEDAAKALNDFIIALTCNQFFLSNAASLVTMLVSCINRWVDGDEWDARGEKEASRFIRCGEIDLFLHVAYLIGGWDHMRANKDVRGYDKVSKED